MDEQKRTEIVPLNRELYKDLSIDDLEERLEQSCIIFVFWCSGTYTCEEYCVFGGGGGGEPPPCPEAVI